MATCQNIPGYENINNCFIINYRRYYGLFTRSAADVLRQKRT